MRIGIFGSGGFGHELVQPLLDIVSELQDGTEAVFIDDAPGEAFLPVVTLDEMEPGDSYIVAVGSGAVRARIDARCRDRGLRPFSLRSPQTYVGMGVETGPGLVLCPFACITARAVIGRQFQANIYSYVAHDCVIGDYVTFGPGAKCNGNVNVGDFAYIATGAIIRNGTPDKPIRIGKGATVGMGAVVTKDVAPGETVVGSPARRLGPPQRRSIASCRG